MTAQNTTFEIMDAPLYGINLVEASAGTGKTWNIEAITVRLFIEKEYLPADVLVVTFTEAATQELKERIYKRLIEVIRVLKSPESQTDDLFLLGCVKKYGPSAARYTETLRHLERCKQRFDEASISTIHGFCKTVLSEFSYLTRTDIDVTIETEGKGSLVEDAVNDFWRLYNANEAILAGGMLAPLLYGPLRQENLIMGMTDLLRQSKVRIRYPELPFKKAPYANLPYPASVDEVASGMVAALHNTTTSSGDAAVKGNPAQSGTGASSVIAALAGQLRQLVSEIRYVWEDEKEVIRKQLADTKISHSGLDKNFEGLESQLFAFLDSPIDYELGTKTFHPRKLGSRYLQEGKLTGKNVYRTDHQVHDRIQQALELAAWIPDFEQRRALEVIRMLYNDRCARDGVTTFDDLLRNVAEALRDDAPENGGSGALHRALQQRYKAGLIDEFQDTDPVQFEIFRRMFIDGNPDAGAGASASLQTGGVAALSSTEQKREHRDGNAALAKGYGDHSNRLLYLIGDPKQAIYKFRGADLRTYMKARELTDQRFTLTMNFRSAANMVDGVNALFEGEYSFIDPELSFDKATAKMSENPFHSAVDAALAGEQGNQKGLHFPKLGSQPFSSKGKATRGIVNWTSSHIARSLESARTGEQTGIHSDEGHLKPLSAGDIAVLVSSNLQARAMKKRLEELGVPAVVGGDVSVFTSEDARLVNLMLDVLVDPQRTTVIRTLLTSRMVGMNAAQMAQLQENDLEWSALLEIFVMARDQALKRGVLSGIRHILDALDVEKRLISWSDGERSITNLRHLSELLYEEQRRSHRNLSGLAQWLRSRRNDPDLELSDNTQMRLESDENRVTIMTMHSSKGLQFPVVYAPFLWDSRKKSSGVALFHDRAEDGFVLDFKNKYSDARLSAQGLDASEAEAALRTQDEENIEDRVRLLYVAVTRAKYRCYVPHAMVSNRNGRSTDSPFVAMLLRDPVAGQIQWRDITEFDRVTGLDQDNLIDELLARLDGADRFVQYEVGADLTSRYQPDMVEEVLVSRQLDENAVERMRQHVFVESYSSLKKQASEAGMSDASYQDGGFQDVNEADDANATRRSSDNNLDISHFPGGTHTGNFWHDIFETIDFSDSSTFLPVIRRLCDEYGFDNTEWEAALLNMVHRVVETDLGGFRLADISLRDALREMEFYLPYRDYEMEAFQRWIEASASEGEAAVSSIREVADNGATGNHASEVGTQSDFNDVRHYLKGFIDLLVVYNGKYYILDYKSDKLNDGPQSYHPDALREHMKLRGYRNQYHYYSLALYLYLRDRLPDVDFDAAFGGVIYLYLRGIGDTSLDNGVPVTHGIFRDRPDPARIVNLAAALQKGIITVEEQ